MKILKSTVTKKLILFFYNLSEENLKTKTDVSGRRGCGLASGRQILIFFIKGNWICAVTRHHAEPNINILLIRNLPFGSDIRQWGHPLMIPLHYFWADSNNTAHGQFECNVTWFSFCFDFVRSHARFACCSIVCLFTFSCCANKTGWLQNEY